MAAKMNALNLVRLLLNGQTRFIELLVKTRNDLRDKLINHNGQINFVSKMC